MSGSGGVRQVLVDSRTPVNYEMVAPVVRAMAADERVQFSFTASEEPGRLDRIYRDADRSPPGESDPAGRRFRDGTRT